MHQLVAIGLARRVYSAIIAPPVKTLISVRAPSKKSFSVPCIFAPNVPSMLRRLRTVTRARLTPDDVEGRIHLRPFPAFYFNDKNTTALSTRVDVISVEVGGRLARKNFTR